MFDISLTLIHTKNGVGMSAEYVVAKYVVWMDLTADGAPIPVSRALKASSTVSKDRRAFVTIPFRQPCRPV